MDESSAWTTRKARDRPVGSELPRAGILFAALFATSLVLLRSAVPIDPLRSKFLGDPR